MTLDDYFEKYKSVTMNRFHIAALHFCEKTVNVEAVAKAVKHATKETDPELPQLHKAVNERWYELLEQEENQLAKKG